MAENEQTKVCPICAETVKAAARKCPHCQTRLKGFPVWMISLTVSSVMSVVLFYGGFVLLGVTLWPLNAQKFASHRQELRVIRPSLKMGRSTPGGWFESLGTNQWEHLWTAHELEIRFIDAQSNLIDHIYPYPTPPGCVSVQPSRWLAGFITNSGDYAWRISELEVRFCDAKSNLVDVETCRPSESYVVQPRCEQAFRLPLFNSTLTNHVGILQVRVQDAYDANSKE